MNDINPIETEHHSYLVALTFEEKEPDISHRIIIKIEKTDTDELCIVTPKIDYWVSLKQFMQLVKGIK